jgi:hypothetical protein
MNSASARPRAPHGPMSGAAVSAVMEFGAATPSSAIAGRSAQSTLPGLAAAGPGVGAEGSLAGAGRHSGRHLALSMYSDPPSGNISIEEFEGLALDRLRGGPVRVTLGRRVASKGLCF